MKKLLLIPSMAVGLTACISENAPSVLDYIKDVQLYNTDKGWCQVNPAEGETEKCLNVRQAYRMTNVDFGSFAKCVTGRGKGGKNRKVDQDCVNDIAKEEGLL